jgi:hypothetical protein
MIAGFALACSFVLSAPVATAADDDGWIVLFDGTSLDGWTPVGDANWRLVDGILEADEGGGHMVSDESYTDFVLRVEFWVNDEANSGIFIRCNDPADPGDESCYEVNIYDQRPDPRYGTGGIVDFAVIENMPKAGGRWNTYTIVAQGDHLVVVLNGRPTADIQDSTHPSGPFGLQYNGGLVRFRRVEIRPL